MVEDQLDQLDPKDLLDYLERLALLVSLDQWVQGGQTANSDLPDLQETLEHKE